MNIIDNFNMNTLDILDLMLKKYPTIEVQMAEKVVERILSKKDKTIIMMFFIKNVYGKDEYRENIIAMNDEYFIKQEYKIDAKDKENMINKIFNFKQTWNKMEKNDKKYIKIKMYELVNLCTDFLLEID